MEFLSMAFQIFVVFVIGFAAAFVVTKVFQEKNKIGSKSDSLPNPKPTQEMNTSNHKESKPKPKKKKTTKKKAVKKTSNKPKQTK